MNLGGADVQAGLHHRPRPPGRVDAVIQRAAVAGALDGHVDADPAGALAQLIGHRGLHRVEDRRRAEMLGGTGARGVGL